MSRFAPVPAAQPDEAAREHRADAERAALRFAHHAGLSPNAVEDRHFNDLKRFYNDDQPAGIVGVIARFGFLNRTHDTLATDLEARPRAAFDTLEKRQ